MRAGHLADKIDLLEVKLIMGGYYSDFLFADASFTEGMARVLDLGGTLTEFNRSLTSEQADAIALAMDWRAVGADMTAVFDAYRMTLPDQSQDSSIDQAEADKAGCT